MPVYHDAECIKKITHPQLPAHIGLPVLPPIGSMQMPHFGPGGEAGCRGSTTTALAACSNIHSFVDSPLSNSLGRLRTLGAGTTVLDTISKSGLPVKSTTSSSSGGLPAPGANAGFA